MLRRRRRLKRWVNGEGTGKEEVRWRFWGQECRSSLVPHFGFMGCWCAQMCEPTPELKPLNQAEIKSADPAEQLLGNLELPCAHHQLREHDQERAIFRIRGCTDTFRSTPDVAPVVFSKQLVKETVSRVCMLKAFGAPVFKRGCMAAARPP